MTVVDDSATTAVQLASLFSLAFSLLTLLYLLHDRFHKANVVRTAFVFKILLALLPGDLPTYFACKSSSKQSPSKCSEHSGALFPRITSLEL